MPRLEFDGEQPELPVPDPLEVIEEIDPDSIDGGVDIDDEDDDEDDDGVADDEVADNLADDGHLIESSDLPNG